MCKVVKSKAVAARFETIRLEFYRFEELQRAIDWFLARDPFHKSTVDLKDPNSETGTCRLWITGALASDFPVLRLVYRVRTGERKVIITAVDYWRSVDVGLQ